MNTIFVVSGHGIYATGIKSNIELIIGKQKNIYYVDFTVDDNDIVLREKIVKIVEENNENQVLLIGDLLGGTPFKTMAQIANDRDNVEVVVGCNIGSIMEAVLGAEDLPLIEIADKMVETSKNSTFRFEKICIGESIASDSYEDGI